MKSVWFMRHRPLPAPTLRLFILPHAGGGTAQFRRWSEALTPRVETCAVLLPGREARLREAPLTSARTLIELLATEMQPFLHQPFAVLGHSMGALLAFELACELRRRGLPLPRKLYLSGRRAPMLPAPPEQPPLHRLPDTEFLEQVCRMGGIPQAVLAEPELPGLILPALRADFTLLETYVWAPQAPLDCPFLMFGGRQDPRASVEQLTAWKELTCRDFDLKLFPGGHFYLHDRGSSFLTELAADLARLPG